MLKYISIEMLEELDERQKEKLQSFWREKGEIICPLISIGDMIEILANADKEISIDNKCIDDTGWIVIFRNESEDYYDDDLVTALWQAVKSIL